MPVGAMCLFLMVPWVGLQRVGYDMHWDMTCTETTDQITHMEEC